MVLRNGLTFFAADHDLEFARCWTVRGAPLNTLAMAQAGFDRCLWGFCGVHKGRAKDAFIIEWKVYE